MHLPKYWVTGYEKTPVPQFQTERIKDGRESPILGYENIPKQCAHMEHVKWIQMWVN